MGRDSTLFVIITNKKEIHIHFFPILAFFLNTRAMPTHIIVLSLSSATRSSKPSPQESLHVIRCCANPPPPPPATAQTALCFLLLPFPPTILFSLQPRRGKRTFLEGRSGRWWQRCQTGEIFAKLRTMAKFRRPWRAVAKF